FPYTTLFRSPAGPPAGCSSAERAESSMTDSSGPTSHFGVWVVTNCYLGLTTVTWAGGHATPLPTLTRLGIGPPIVRQWRPGVWVIIRRQTTGTLDLTHHNRVITA